MNANQLEAMNLYACATRHLECDSQSIRRYAASQSLTASPQGMAEVTAAMIRSMEFGLDLMLHALALSHGDDALRDSIAARVARLESVIADRRIELAGWLEIPVLVAQDEAERAVKH